MPGACSDKEQAPGKGKPTMNQVNQLSPEKNPISNASPARPHQAPIFCFQQCENDIRPANFLAAARLARLFAAQERANCYRAKKRDTRYIKFRTLEECMSDFLGYASAAREEEN